MIQEAHWDILPFPFTQIATALPIKSLDASSTFGRMLEDVTGLAGGLASATSPEADDLDPMDVFFASRLLSEHLHAALAFWQAWQAQEREAAPAGRKKACP